MFAPTARKYHFWRFQSALRRSTPKCSLEKFLFYVNPSEVPGDLSPGQLKRLENKGGFLKRGRFLINISTDLFKTFVDFVPD